MGSLDLRIPTLIAGVLITAIGSFLIGFHRYALFPEQPKLAVKISRQTSNYRDGLQINGVTWSKGYEIYGIALTNDAVDSEAGNISLMVGLPGAILSTQAEVVGGGERPQITSFRMPMEVSDPAGQVQSVQTPRTNNFILTANSLKPKGAIVVTTVLEPKGDLADKGFVDLAHSFVGFLDKRNNVRLIHPVTGKGAELVVDDSRTLPVNFPRKLAYFLPNMGWSVDFEENMN